ncbi:MAG: sulfatase-like hydrolase/transferase [Clostridiales Family XIII bacterium]|jgi:phosphoglycerol transferase MdoB-like AlkP superfamily enzyme|nr:sulfatase-like hydrolase/transferase [Clostridiales Family XIII bacterium]
MEPHDELRGLMRFRVLFEKLMRNPIALSAVLAIALNIVIEAAGRHSVLEALGFMFTRPPVFLLNALIIFLTLSTAMLFRRRILVYAVWSVFWLALGVANGVILSYRMTPFTMKDLSLLESGITVVPSYLSKLQIGIVIAAMAMSALLFIALFIFAPKKQGSISRVKNLGAIVLIFAISVGSLFSAVKFNVTGTVFGNLAYAYKDYGVAYCFMNTWLNTGIKRPLGYSEYSVRTIFNKGELQTMGSYELYSDAGASTFPKTLPNIIFLQMESFIDPSEMKGLTYSEEPAPWFHSMRENYSSGYLTVPSIGAGTANTEFEVLSGMSVKFFGPGEYPYKSVLKDVTCESMAYSLKELGYTSHAIHNHRGAFYNRNQVFANLGFDTFTSIEYMNDVLKTPRNWAKDGVLTEQVLGAMNSTEGKDFIFAISVQGHGSYPEKQVIENPYVRVSGFETEAETNAFEYYIQQVREMDDFLRELTEQLDSMDEEVVLVIYGDHLPALDISDEDMKNGSSFETQYVIWSNYALERKSNDLYSYQLAAELESQLGITRGTLMAYHQHHADDKFYLEKLKKLQYDMLYGNAYVYEGREAFEPTELQMGFSPIRVNKVVKIADNYYVYGKGFTPYSKASVNGEIFETEFLSPDRLMVSEAMTDKEAAMLQVSQVGKNDVVLSVAGQSGDEELWTDFASGNDAESE